MYEDDFDEIIESKIILDGVDEPYIVEEKIVKRTERKYNPEYGDSRVCECGHNYYRHFDTWEDMYPCGCKYCNCYEFVEKNKGE